MKEMLTLAIETSQTGSLALFKGSELVGSVAGSKEVSRSEDLIMLIEGLLSGNGLNRRSIDTIAVSLGPGSFTGIRVGLSVALGLSTALGCKRIGVPTLTAMTADSTGKNVLCVVPAGRTQCYWQLFERSDMGYEPAIPPALGTYPELQAAISGGNVDELISDELISDELSEHLGPAMNEVVKLCPADKLAEMVGKAGLRSYGSSELVDITPIYIRSATVR